jgi:N6-adenosine-specific RNA methylase IME4
VKRYRTIVADPPWEYDGAGPKARALYGRHKGEYSPLNGVNTKRDRYGAMSMGELQAIRPPAEDDAHLYLWTTNQFIVEAHELARAWGFRPKTILTWGKIQSDGKPSMKMGHHFRGATEHVVFGVKGSLALRADVALPTLYLWPRRPHSVKPDAFYDLVEQASPGPYVELFARRARFGWDYYGNQSLGTAEMARPDDDHVA